MNVPDGSVVTDWVVALLEGDTGSFQVGDHRAPDAPVEYPYWVVWQIPGGFVGGPPLGAAAADAGYVFQVDSVGRTRQQSQMLASRARDRVAGRSSSGAYTAAAVPPTGMVVNDRISDGSPGSPIAEGTYPNEVWTTSERFIVSVTLT